MLLLLLLVNLALVDKSLDFPVHDVAVLAPEDLHVHQRREGAQLLAAGNRPFRCDPACVVDGDLALRGQELHEKVADLVRSCCVFGQGGRDVRWGGLELLVGWGEELFFVARGTFRWGAGAGDGHVVFVWFAVEARVCTATEDTCAFNVATDYDTPYVLGCVDVCQTAPGGCARAAKAW